MIEMARLFAAGFLALLISSPGAGNAGGIADVAWTEPNLDVLRAFDKTAIEELANGMKNDGMHATVGEFTWVDLAGDKKYELVTREDLSGRAYFDYLAVYSRSASGKVKVDWIEGTGLPTLDKIIRDLDGDGTSELVVPSALDEHDPRGNAEWPSRVWPKVYRLRNGHYVEASGEFAAYYDSEVLPKLDRAIEQARQEAASKPPREHHERRLLVLELTRDKIGQTLGRGRSSKSH